MRQPRALLAWALLALLGLGEASAEDLACCGLIVPRSEWGGLPSGCEQQLQGPVRYVVVSHTVGNHCDSPALCRQEAQNVQNYHVRTRGYCDVGYNFLIGEDGLVYEGRGWNVKGDHSGKYWNPISIGITFMGNYMERLPQPRAIRAAQSLLACGVAQKALFHNYEVKGHRDVQQTLSPGDRLYEIIEKWPHYKE